MKENAREELLEHLEEISIDDSEVEYVSIKCYVNNIKRVTIEGSLEEVLPQLDFEYKSGYGTQYLFGTIWYTDGTWSSRAEYDGSEWWAYNKRPPIPRKSNSRETK